MGNGTQMTQIFTDFNDFSANQYLLQNLTNRIIKVFYKVYNNLGYGFLEKVYQNAMTIELAQAGFLLECQKRIVVFYQQKKVGEYFADIVVNNSVILELKAAEALRIEHENQLINYLRATNCEIGLLLNFGLKPEIRRKIFTNDRKKYILIRDNL